MNSNLFVKCGKKVSAHYLNTLHSFFYFNINKPNCQGKLYNLIQINNKLPVCMWKKTVDKRKKSVIMVIIKAYLKALIRKALLKNGSQRVPEAVNGTFRSFSVTTLWVRPIHGGKLPLQSTQDVDPRFLFAKYYCWYIIRVEPR